ncbi:unnamed protein product [Merluccius merluccius]
MSGTVELSSPVDVELAAGPRTTTNESMMCSSSLSWYSVDSLPSQLVDPLAKPVAAVTTRRVREKEDGFGRISGPERKALHSTNPLQQESQEAVPHCRSPRKKSAYGVDFEKVHDTGLEYVDALGEVENEEEKAEEEAAHAEEKTAKCLATYTETLQLAKETLWTKFGYVDIKLYADGAEEKCAEVENIDMKELTEEVLRDSLVERLNMFERKVLEWESLVSGAKTTVYKQQLYKLGNRLHDWWWQKLKRTEELGKGEEAEEVGTDGERSESGEGPSELAGSPNSPERLHF